MSIISVYKYPFDQGLSEIVEYNLLRVLEMCGIWRIIMEKLHDVKIGNGLVVQAENQEKKRKRKRRNRANMYNGNEQRNYGDERKHKSKKIAWM